VSIEPQNNIMPLSNQNLQDSVEILEEKTDDEEAEFKANDSAGS